MRTFTVNVHIYSVNVCIYRCIYGVNAHIYRCIYTVKARIYTVNAYERPLPTRVIFWYLEFQNVLIQYKLFLYKLQTAGRKISSMELPFELFFLWAKMTKQLEQ